MRCHLGAEDAPEKREGRKDDPRKKKRTDRRRGDADGRRDREQGAPSSSIIATVGGIISSRARESTPKGAPDQERLLERQGKPPPRTREATQGVGGDASGCKQDTVSLLAREDPPPDGEHIAENTRTP